jgi:hypothetical protein
MVVHKDDRGSLGQQQHVSQHSVGGGGVVSADQRLERPLEALQHLWIIKQNTSEWKARRIKSE